MSKIYKIEYLNNITRVNFTDKPSYKETTRIIDEIAKNYPYEKRLWDLTDSNFNFTEQEIIDIAKYGKLKFINPSKIAIIAPNDIAYGEMRQFMVYREEENKADACVFRTEEEAINWLNQ